MRDFNTKQSRALRGHTGLCSKVFAGHSRRASQTFDIDCQTNILTTLSEEPLTGRHMISRLPLIPLKMQCLILGVEKLDQPHNSLQEDLQRLYERHNLYITNSEISNVSCIFEGANFIYNSHLSGRIKMGIKSYVNPRSRLRHVDIGRYCSIADGVFISAEQHSLNMISSHPFMINLSTKEDADVILAKTIVGNDVWVGAYSILMPGIVIGNGAVIGASSFVNKSVEPYAIVAGSPAKKIRMRFSDAIIERLERVGWWDYPMDYIGKCDLTDVSATIDRLEIAIDRGILTRIQPTVGRLDYVGYARIDNYSNSIGV